MGAFHWRMTGARGSVPLEDDERQWGVSLDEDGSLWGRFTGGWHEPVGVFYWRMMGASWGVLLEDDGSQLGRSTGG